jgi:EpsI family protein
MAWRATRHRPGIYLQVLQLSDYLTADYRGPAPRPVDLYIAWYGSQDKGRYMHSPRTCLPGGGWKILELTQVDVPGVKAAGQPLRVNRAIMGSGTASQLVYYWFQQRGRVTTDEKLTKWHLLWDSVIDGRSDGALVRLIVPLADGEQTSNADADLARFAAELTSELDRYVPR